MEIPRQKMFKFTTKLPRGGILDSFLVLGITYLEHILEVVDHFVFDVKIEMPNEKCYTTASCGDCAKYQQSLISNYPESTQKMPENGIINELNLFLVLILDVILRENLLPKNINVFDYFVHCFPKSI